MRPAEKHSGAAGRTSLFTRLFSMRALVPLILPLLTAAFVPGCSRAKEEPARAKPPLTAPIPPIPPLAPLPPSAPPAPPAVMLSGDPVNGKSIYGKHCHYCHGAKGMGDGPVGLALTPRPADFVHDTKRMSKTDEELLRSITDGMKREIGGEAMFMPAWATILTEKERRDVLAYVRQLEREGKEREAKGGK